VRACHLGSSPAKLAFVVGPLVDRLERTSPRVRSVSISAPLCCMNTYTIKWRKGVFGFSWLLIDRTDHANLDYQNATFPGTKDGVELMWNTLLELMADTKLQVL